MLLLALFCSFAFPNCLEQLVVRAKNSNGHLIQFAKVSWDKPTRSTEAHAFGLEVLERGGFMLTPSRDIKMPSAEVKISRNWIRRLLSSQTKETEKMGLRLADALIKKTDTSFSLYAEGERDIAEVMVEFNQMGREDHNNSGNIYAAAFLFRMLLACPAIAAGCVYLAMPKLEPGVAPIVTGISIFSFTIFETLFLKVNEFYNKRVSAFFHPVYKRLKQNKITNDLIYLGFDVPFDWVENEEIAHNEVWHFDLLYEDAETPRLAMFISKDDL